MSSGQEFDSVTGFIFFMTGLIAALGAWYYTIRRLRAYSRYGASHKASRRPMHAQLRLGVADGQPAWLYSTTW